MHARKCVIESRRDIPLRCAPMSNPACPMCEMNDVLEHPGRWECATCGHEISCKVEGIAVGLKACFVKKA